jgi:hypothetical protein
LGVIVIYGLRTAIHRGNLPEQLQKMAFTLRRLVTFALLRKIWNYASEYLITGTRNSIAMRSAALPSEDKFVYLLTQISVS